MQKLKMHHCQQCGKSFEIPAAPKPLEILTTPKNHIPLEDFTHVTCPSCGHTELASERKFFGLIGPRGLQILVGAIVLGVIIATLVSSL
jgi:predicted nucleic-acid-binding Zn-ribbon protein